MNAVRIRHTSYALIFAQESGQILLTLLNRGPNSGKWTLPGGGLDVNESPRQGLEREVYEEAGLKLSEFEFLTRFDSEYHYPDQDSVRVIKNLFVKKIEKPLPVEVVLKGDSTLDVKWFSLKDLDMSLVHPTALQALSFYQKQFRRAELKDAEVLAAFVNAAYRGDSSREGWTTEADILGGQRVDADKIKEMILTPDSFIELLTDKSDPSQSQGCVYLKRETSDSLFFGMLVVSPTLQGAGIGKLLLSRIETIAYDLGCREVRMSVVHVREELIKFYERRGYQATGRSEPFPTNDPRFGVPLVEGLKLLEFKKTLIF